MKTLIAAMVMTAAFPGLAASADTNIEQRKADQIKRVDERIAHLQEERACILAAATQESLKACHEKFKNEIKADKANRIK